MKIKEVSINEQELLKAVEEWFQKHFNLNFKIEEVSKKYSYSTEYTVTVAIDEVKTEVAAALIETSPRAALAEFKDNE